MLFATFNFFCCKQCFVSARAPFPFPLPHTSIQQNLLNVQYTTIDKQRFRMVKFMKKRGLKITWHCLFNNIEIKQLTSGFCYKKTILLLVCIYGRSRIFLSFENSGAVGSPKLFDASTLQDAYQIYLQYFSFFVCLWKGKQTKRCTIVTLVI